MLPAVLSLAQASRPAARPSARPAEKAHARVNAWGRADFEFYPTPPEATRALLSVETFKGNIWEPACGQGHISKVLETAGYDVVSTDLVDHGYAAARTGLDFTECVFPRAKHIVTNPPYGYGLADAFVSKALAMAAITGGTVAMLLNIVSLCHRSRHEFWTTHKPARVYALDDCVCFPNGRPEQATRHTHNHRYVWVLWEPGSSPSTTEFRWLSTAPFTDAARRKRNAQSTTTRRPS
jgi:hypothetical protein